MNLDDIYRYAEENGYLVVEVPLRGTRAASIGLGGIGIDPAQIGTNAERSALIAHELGHLQTAAMYPKTAPPVDRSRCEERANRWAYQKLVPPGELGRLLADGRDIGEIAEHFEVPEAFIRSAYRYYLTAGVGFSAEEAAAVEELAQYGLPPAKPAAGGSPAAWQVEPGEPGVPSPEPPDGAAGLPAQADEIAQPVRVAAEARENDAGQRPDDRGTGEAALPAQTAAEARAGDAGQATGRGAGATTLPARAAGEARAGDAGRPTDRGAETSALPAQAPAEARAGDAGQAAGRQVREAAQKPPRAGKPTAPKAGPTQAEKSAGARPATPGAPRRLAFVRRGCLIVFDEVAPGDVVMPPPQNQPANDPHCPRILQPVPKTPPRLRRGCDIDIWR